MASSALCEDNVGGLTQLSRTAQGLVFTMSGGSTSMLRHSTRAELAVFSFPGIAPRQGTNRWDHGGPGVGLPQVRWRLTEK